MARKPQVRYFESRGAFYFQYKGKQHKLAEGPDDSPTGPTYLAALGKFKEILALDGAVDAKDNNTVGVICEKYLRHIEGRRSASTYRIRQRYLSGFCREGFCDRIVKSLTHADVYAYTDERRQRPVKKFSGFAGEEMQWTDGTVRMLQASLLAAFNWAVRSGLLTKNPLDGIEVPGPNSRGAESLVTPEEHQAILQLVWPAFRQLIIALENTGARPSELTNATAADWDDGVGGIIYRKDGSQRKGGHKHKTASKGKDRVIFFTGEALEMVRDLVVKHPTGYLFQPVGCWSKGKWRKAGLYKNFRKLRRKLGTTKPLTAYSYRHTFATAWLTAGKSVDLLAELMGNSPIIIRRHYSHLLSDKRNLRAALEAFRAEGNGSLRASGGTSSVSA